MSGVEEIILQDMGQNKGRILAAEYPELAKEWNYEKNGHLTPFDVTTGSNKKVWWICPLGHEWEARIKNRVYNGSGCPFCAHQRLLKGFNDMATTNPEMVAEWDYEGNGELKPGDVFAHSASKAWWICPKGHPSYYMQLAMKADGAGCPICGNERIRVFQSRQVFEYSLEGELLHTYPSAKAAAEANGVSKNVVSQACRGELTLCADHVFRYAHQLPKKKHSAQFTEKKKLLDGLNQLVSAGDEVMFIRNAYRRDSKIVRGTVIKITEKCAIIQTGANKNICILLCEGDPASLTKVIVMHPRPGRTGEDSMDASGYQIREGDPVVYIGPLLSNRCKGFEYGTVKKAAGNTWEVNGTRRSSDRIVVVNW